MGDKAKIAWTDATWNPLRGCSKVSAGCKNCYALTMAHRFSGPGQPYEGLTREVGGKPAWTGTTKKVYDKLDQPMRWQRPRRVFVNSTSDLFHESVPFEYVATVFAVMAASPTHTFQILTKRPEAAEGFFSALRTQCWDQDIAEVLAWTAKDVLSDGSPEDTERQYWRVRDGLDAMAWPLLNVWLGVSVEDQKAADERVPVLHKLPAVARFLSCEPLLGPVELGSALRGLAWVIVGGESGPGARPMRQEWAESLQAQCKEASVAFFFKQMGSAWAKEAGTASLKGEDLAEVPESLRVRDFPG
jgi:protein gp37